MKQKCSTPKCRRKPVLHLLGDHPICRKCGDEKNRKARIRSAKRRAAGLYPPSTIARRSRNREEDEHDAAIVNSRRNEILISLSEILASRIFNSSKSRKAKKLRIKKHPMLFWTPHLSNQSLHTHDASVCMGRPCCVHSPSNHHMRDWPQHYRTDTGVTERICPHGVGHPDPDQPWPKDAWQWVHGCDGCCTLPKQEDK